MIQDEYRLYQRLTLHGGGEFPINRNVSMVPGFVIFSQGPSFEGNLGNSFRFDMGSTNYFSQSLEVGGWVRLVNNYIDEKYKKLVAVSVIISETITNDLMGIGL